MLCVVELNCYVAKLDLTKSYLASAKLPGVAYCLEHEIIGLQIDPKGKLITVICLAAYLLWEARFKTLGWRHLVIEIVRVKSCKTFFFEPRKFFCDKILYDGPSLTLYRKIGLLGFLNLR